MDERLRFVARLLERGEDGAAVSGVRDLPQDWLQDLQSVQGLRGRGADGPLPQALPACPPAALPDREADPAAQAGTSELGCSEDP